MGEGGWYYVPKVGSAESRIESMVTRSWLILLLLVLQPRSAENPNENDEKRASISGVPKD